MSIWNYISEFLLFRWLFGAHKHRNTDNGMADYPTHSCNNGKTDDYHHFGSINRNENSFSYSNDHDYESYHSQDDFFEEQDDFDMMDDF